VSGVSKEPITGFIHRQRHLPAIVWGGRKESPVASRLGYLLYWTVSWIAVIVIAAGFVVWLHLSQPNKDPLGLVIVGWGVILWLAARAIRYWLTGR
jgi:hypothetical protein